MHVGDLVSLKLGTRRGMRRGVSALSWYERGLALESVDPAGAITAYERAIDLRPNLFQALRALATLYEQKGFRRKAAEALERALHSAPDVQTRDALRARLIKLL